MVVRPAVFMLRAAEAEDRRQARERAARAQLARGNAFVDEMESMLRAGAAAGATPEPQAVGAAGRRGLRCARAPGRP